MFTHDFEDWLVGLSLIIAVAVPIGLRALTSPIASEAIAAVSVEPQYKITITARRVPAQCKGLAFSAAPAACEAYLGGDTTMVIRERSAQ